MSGWRLFFFPLIYLFVVRQLLVGWFGLSNHFPNDWYNHAMSFALFSGGFLLGSRESIWSTLERLRWHFLAITAVATGPSREEHGLASPIVTVEITRRDEVETAMNAACTMAFQSGEAVAVLLTQKLIGAKKF